MYVQVLFKTDARKAERTAKGRMERGSVTRFSGQKMCPAVDIQSCGFVLTSFCSLRL